MQSLAWVHEPALSEVRKERMVSEDTVTSIRGQCKLVVLNFESCGELRTNVDAQPKLQTN